jgi:hypothetical protein
MNSTEKILCEATSSSVSLEIPRILWNTKAHHRTHNSPPPVPVLSQIHPFKTPQSSILKIHFNILLLSSQGLQSCLCPSGLLTRTLYGPLPLPNSATIHSSWFDHSVSIWWTVQMIKLLVVQSSPPPCYLVPLRPKYLPQQPIHKPLACFSLSVTDQVS